MFLTTTNFGLRVFRVRDFLFFKGISGLGVRDFRFLIGISRDFLGVIYPSILESCKGSDGNNRW